MDFFELIKNYGNGKGEKIMWEVTKNVSDFIKPLKESNPEDYWLFIKNTFATLNGPHYNEDFAMWQINRMYYKNKNGEKITSPHYSKDKYKSVYESIKSRLNNNNYNLWDIAVTMEMVYSDNVCLYMSWWDNITEDMLLEKVTDEVINYLNDDDDTEGKIWNRFNK